MILWYSWLWIRDELVDLGAWTQKDTDRRDLLNNLSYREMVPALTISPVLDAPSVKNNNDQSLYNDTQTKDSLVNMTLPAQVEWNNHGMTTNTTGMRTTTTRKMSITWLIRTTRQSSLELVGLWQILTTSICSM